jgi:hypothetical protein
MRFLWLITILLTTVYSANAWEVIPGDRECTIKTERLSAVIRDGAIIELRDLKQDRLWSDRQLKDAVMPTGLGILYDLPTFKLGHVPWGDPAMNQHLKLNFAHLNYFRPVKQSEYELKQIDKQVHITWRGLDNGKVFLPSASLTLTLKADNNGALMYQVSGNNPDGGVFSANCQVINLTKNAKVIVPSFGGLGYSGDGTPGLIPLGGAPFMEAPVMLAENDHNSFSIWLEDPSMRSFFGYIGRTGKSLGMTLEVFTLMPYEDKETIETPFFKLDIFDGDWKNAAAPYRKWYQSYFQKELAVRNSVPWVENVRNIIDIYMTVPNESELAKIAQLFPKNSVMFQVWNARAAKFDTELPDWTPRKGYIEGVKRLHGLDFKVMAYVNSYCVNYQSRLWKRDQLDKFVLTRKNSPWNYKGKSVADTENSMHEKLIGTVDYSDGANQFANIPVNRLLYTDPLSPQWRRYHAEQMEEWNSTTGTDANYEDTAGCTGDFGNGIVDGLSAGEGSVAHMRLLQQVQPQVPMSSEYGNTGIAFATSWALNYVGHWGLDSFKRYRINHQYPLTTYLFGYRQWVSAMISTDDLRCHAMAATSDATGGLGFSLVDFFLRRDEQTINSDYSWKGHLYNRAKVFTERQLSPYFPADNYPDNIRCQYQGNDGIYSYYDDGALQQMLTPRGEPLYGRVSGANKISTSLWLANWPLQNGTEIYGLNPDKHYPLFQRPEHAETCAVSINNLPENIALNQYYAQDGFAYLEFIGLQDAQEEVSFSLIPNCKYSSYYANDQEVNPENIHGKLPLRLVCVNATTHKLNQPIGVIKQQETKTFRGQTLYRSRSGHLDFPVTVSDKNQALEFNFRNYQEKYPYHGYDGSIVRFLINGEDIKAFDCLPEPKKNAVPDTQMRRWIIPVGKYTGKTILVSIVVDCKKNPVQDYQFVGVPKLIKNAEQKFSERMIGASFTVKSIVAKPEKWDGGPVVDAGNNAKMIKGTGVRFAAGSVKIDPAKTYRLCGNFKAAVPSDKGFLLFGMAPHNAAGKPIHPLQVNPVSDSDTVLAASAKKGDTKISVKNAEKWRKANNTAIAFNTKTDYDDLPNHDLVEIATINQNEVTLKKPLSKDYPAGTPVRQHCSGNTYMYSGAAYKKVPSTDWTEFSGEISGEAISGLPMNQFWRGTSSVRIMLITSQPDVMFRDIRFEEIE